MKSASCLNLVVVINDQGSAHSPIDYIKKKTNKPWCLLIQLKNIVYITK